MNVVTEILSLYEQAGSVAYYGEQVTQLQHALQTADCAVRAGADDELVAAALLHDIGHLLGGDFHADLGVIDHDRTCGDWLRQRGFPERVIALVAGHVLAKRYLVATHPGYQSRLSETSKRTLQLQGGPLSPREVAEFEASPHYKDLLRLRAWDDAAKDPLAPATALSAYAPLLARVCPQS